MHTCGCPWAPDWRPGTRSRRAPSQPPLALLQRSLHTWAPTAPPCTCDRQTCVHTSVPRALHSSPCRDAHTERLQQWVWGRRCLGRGTPAGLAGWHHPFACLALGISPALGKGWLPAQTQAPCQRRLIYTWRPGPTCVSRVLVYPSLSTDENGLQNGTETHFTVFSVKAVSWLFQFGCLAMICPPGGSRTRA